jgi:hypothetical protein
MFLIRAGWCRQSSHGVYIAHLNQIARNHWWTGPQMAVPLLSPDIFIGLIIKAPEDVQPFRHLRLDRLF